jgi:hypothetical protein
VQEFKAALARAGHPAKGGKYQGLCAHLMAGPTCQVSCCSCPIRTCPGCGRLPTPRQLRHQSNIGAGRNTCPTLPAPSTGSEKCLCIFAPFGYDLLCRKRSSSLFRSNQGHVAAGRHRSSSRAAQLAQAHV